MRTKRRPRMERYCPEPRPRLSGMRSRCRFIFRSAARQWSSTTTASASPGAEPTGEFFMPAGTVRFHRVLRAKPERVYRAFLDAAAMAKWLPPHGFTGKVHEMDAKVGGGYRMSFTNFSTGSSHSFGGKYLELVPNEL